MTVAQLIERLRTYPRDLEVYVADWNEGHRQPIALTQMVLYDDMLVLEQEPED